MRFGLKSILKIAPAALIGLIPMGFLEEANLALQYKLRGPRPGPESVLVIEAASDPTGLVQTLETALSGNQICISLTPATGYKGRCRFIDLSRKYSVRALIESIEGPALSFEPMFFGSKQEFKSETWLGERQLSLSPSTRYVVIVDPNERNSFMLSTPMGAMKNSDVFLNILASLAEGIEMQTTHISVQFMVSVGFTLLAAFTLYSLPILLTAIVLVSFALFYWVIGLLSLDLLHLQIPIIAPLLSILFVYILGLSDQIDRREKFEWRLRQEADALRELDEMRHNFVSLVTHDLKTPLAQIHMALEQLLSKSVGDLSPEQSKILQNALSANGFLRRSIGSILLLSRIESRQFSVRAEPTDLVEVLKSAVQAVQESAKAQDLKIEEDMEPLFLIDADASLLKEVAVNLLENAIKYSPRGGKLVVRTGESDILQDLSPPQAGIFFEIQDFGPGIPLEERHRLFEKFFQGRQSPLSGQQSVRGTGLGLYLSHFFVEKHQGQLSMISKTLDEKLVETDKAFAYFKPSESGTLARVALPLEPSY